MSALSPLNKSVLGLFVATILTAGAAFAADPQPALNGAADVPYDEKAPVSLKGKVVSVDDSGSRIVIHLDATKVGPKDTPTGKWVLRSTTLATLDRNGYPPKGLTGKTLTIDAFRLADKDCTDGCKAVARRIVFPDGASLYIGSSATAPEPQF